MKLKNHIPTFVSLGMLTIVLFLHVDADAQQIKMRNLPNFDERRFHFGMLLGFNNSSFFLDRKQAPGEFNDSLLTSVPDGQSGFDIHMLASLDLTPNFHLRFHPGLSFQDRALQYSYRSTTDTQENDVRRTESVFLEFPLSFKLRTNRANNFAAYAIVGGKYGIDMQTQKDAENLGDLQIVKLRRNDYGIEAGGGFDFFLTYFKLGFELKAAYGLPNLLIQENNNFTRGIESLRSRSLMFTVTFEG